MTALASRVGFATHIYGSTDNVYGCLDGAWVRYLTILNAIEQAGSDWQATGTLRPKAGLPGTRRSGNWRAGMVYAFSRELTFVSNLPVAWRPLRDRLTAIKRVIVRPDRAPMTHFCGNRACM
jgi:hypothetical protein